jgi:hydrogenase maturation protease
VSTLVAGIGNIFLGDDGFGVEVAQRLASVRFQGEVKVRDFGIRGIHLAYEMLDGGYQTTILVDATPRGGAPGTLYLIEPQWDTVETPSPADAHSMNPQAVLGAVKALGGSPGRVLIVGCEPATVEEGMGLSPPVAQAVGEAVEFVRELIAKGEPDVPGDSRTDRGPDPRH